MLGSIRFDIVVDYLHVPQGAAGQPNEVFHGCGGTFSRASRAGRTRPFFSSSSPCRIPSTDRKSTRLNSSHSQISYAVFCLKKKNINTEKTLNDQRAHRL